MSDQQAAALASALTHLAANQKVLEAAVLALVSDLSAPSKIAIAAAVRERVAHLIAQQADRPDAASDAAMSLALAALLEAADQPPSF